MKRFLKWTGATLGVILLAGIGLAAHTWYLKPLKIEWLYERIFIQFALENPELLSRLRILEPFGLDFYQDDLNDASPAQRREMAAMTRDNLETLRAYDRSALSEDERLSYDILEWFLDNEVRGQQFLFHDYPINQLFGEQSSLPDFMVEIHRVKDTGDAESYVARLERFDDKFQQILAGLRLREERGIVPPAFVIDRVLEEMRSFIDKPVIEHLLYTDFEDKLQALDSIDASRRDALLASAKQAMDTSVYPAYRELIEHFAALESQVTTNHGAWKLPEGAAFYRHQIRTHTTTDMTAGEIHRLGLDEVERIQRQMDAILDSKGYTEGTVGERMRALGEAERFLYPDSQAGREQILADYGSIIDTAQAAVVDVFDVQPEAEVEVKRVPEFKEDTAPGAYYQGPSLDGSRPGRFFANLRDVTEVPKFGMRTLAHHEAVPGHHFQIAIQQELGELPTFRRIIPFTAYTEGWALYAERLTKEIGLMDDPYDDLGRLQAELFRAVRLVVDTGIHHKRWSRERAIDYMYENTGMARSEVVSEVERYFVIPGQALAYKVGMEKILALRERARQALGERFELRDFHDVVLTNGAMPLELLEREVEDYIASQRHGDGAQGTAQ